MHEEPIALEAYSRLADAFAARIDTHPSNACYDRPAVISLLPPVEGRRVLDAGCGPGVYAEWLAGRGAEVVGVGVAHPNALSKDTVAVRVVQSIGERDGPAACPCSAGEGIIVKGFTIGGKSPTQRGIADGDGLRRNDEVPGA